MFFFRDKEVGPSKFLNFRVEKIVEAFWASIFLKPSAKSQLKPRAICLDGWIACTPTAVKSTNLYSLILVSFTCQTSAVIPWQTWRQYKLFENYWYSQMFFSRHCGRSARWNRVSGGTVEEEWKVKNSFYRVDKVDLDPDSWKIK